MRTVVITRKIELRFNSPDKDERREFYNAIKKWQQICYQAANQISSHLFFMLQESNFHYINEKAKRVIADKNFFKDMTAEQREVYFKNEDREIYKIVAEQEKEMITGTLQNSFYQMLSRRYLTECPSSILTALNQRVFKTFTENKMEYLKGNKSLASYRNTLPIPIQATNLTKIRRHIKDGEGTKDFAFSLFGHPLRTNFGLDLSRNAEIMKEAFSSWFLPGWIWEQEQMLSDFITTMKGMTANVDFNGHKYKIEAAYEDDKIYYYSITVDQEYSFRMMPAKKAVKDSDGKILKNEKGKKVSNTIYKIVSNIRLLDSTLQLSEGRHEFKNGKEKDITRIYLLATLEFEKEKSILKEDMTANVTLSPEQPITLQIGKKEFYIGSKDDFLYRRQGIEGAYRRTQRDLKGARGGHGRGDKLKALEQYNKYEANVVKDKLHNYSRQCIKICREYECKYIHLQTRELSPEELKEKQLIERYWTPSKLIEFINYKAEKAGMVVAIEK